MSSALPTLLEKKASFRRFRKKASHNMAKMEMIEIVPKTNIARFFYPKTNHQPTGI